jgi:hypothetical protein
VYQQDAGGGVAIEHVALRAAHRWHGKDTIAADAIARVVQALDTRRQSLGTRRQAQITLAAKRCRAFRTDAYAVGRRIGITKFAAL